MIPNGPARVLRVYGALLSLELQAAAAYRAQLALGTLSWVVPVAFLALWRGAAGEADIEGITADQFATYYCVLLFTTGIQLTNFLSFSIAPLVHSGQLSALLLRPHHPLHPLIARGVAGHFYGMTLMLGIVPILIWLLGREVTAERSQWVLTVGVGLVGFACQTYIAAMMGSVALWLTRSEGLRGLLFGAEWMLGGLIAPIALLPGILPGLLRHQPLWFAIGAPGEAMAGISRLTPWVLLEAVCWLLLLHRLFGVVWRRGMVRYEAVGT